MLKSFCLAVLAFAVFGAERAGVAAQSAEPSTNWVELGAPADSEYTTHLGVSPDWPADPLLLVVSNGRLQKQVLRRSVDGGRTWEQLPDLPGKIRWLKVRVDRLVFASICDSQGRACRLLRSADAGSTWEEVAAVGGSGSGEPSNITLTPDGVVFVVQDGKLVRSRDRGETWDAVVPVAGRRVHQLAVSPAFGNDRTVFASVTAGRFEDRDDPADRPAFDAALAGEADVMVSHDGGDTWAPSSSGLELDGQPHRHVQELVISPTYAQDGTLFAFTWGAAGPPPPEQSLGRGVRSVLFKSPDRGVTWDAIWEAGSDAALAGAGWPGMGSPRFRASLAFSPKLAENGVGILALNWWYVGRTYDCMILRTADVGHTWAPIMPRRGPSSHRLERCGHAELAGEAGLTGLWLATYDHFDRTQSAWVRTTDGGQTVEVLSPPMLDRDPYWTSIPPLVSIADGSVIAGTQRIWALGP